MHYMSYFMIQKLTLLSPTISLLFKSYSLVEVIYQQIRFNGNMFLLCNKKSTDRINVNEQKAYNTEKHTFRKRYLVIPPPPPPPSILEQPLLFIYFSLFMGKF